MKWGTRFILVSALLCVIAITIFLFGLEEKFEIYDPISYIQSSIPWLSREEMPLEDADSWFVEDKIIVIPAMEDQDTSWVAEDLPQYAGHCKIDIPDSNTLRRWQRAIYIVNPSSEHAHNSSVLKTALNKGHEAMVSFVLLEHEVWVAADKSTLVRPISPILSTTMILLFLRSSPSYTLTETDSSGRGMLTHLIMTTLLQCVLYNSSSSNKTAMLI